MTSQQYPEPTVGALIFNSEGKMLLIKSHKFMNKYTIVKGYIYDSEFTPVVHVIYNLVQFPDGGILGGLCAGIGYRYGFDPLYTRLGFIALTFSGDIGIPLYVITCWLVDKANTPDDYKLRIHGMTPLHQEVKSSLVQ